jgi:hypothetical protein
MVCILTFQAPGKNIIDVMIFEISPEPSLRLDARMNGNADFDSLLTQKGVTVLADFQVTTENKK